MSPGAHILFIGIDAGEPSLLLEWARAGVMPALGALLGRGTATRIQNPAGLYSGSTWPSFYTGLHPGEHGRYASARFHPATYESQRADPRAVRGEPLWDALSHAGKRVAVVDVPRAYLSSLVRLQIIDWGTHAPHFDFCTVPADLSASVVKHYGRHPLPRREQTRRTVADCAELRDGLVSGVRTKARFCGDWLDEDEWDLFLVVFGESHCIGHQCWHLHDPTHPEWRPEVAAAVGDPVRDVYIAIDAAIAQLVRGAGPDAAAIVYANNGMTSLSSGTHLLDEILSAFERAEAAPLRRQMDRVRRRLRRRFGPAPAAETARRRYFQVFTNESSGGVRINLAGREGRGRVHPGQEYEALCTSLANDLSALVNVDTGARAVRGVWRPHELYSGAEAEGLPDLLVEWSAGAAPIAGVCSPKVGTIRGTYRGPRTGDHTPEGLMIGAGPRLGRRRFDATMDVTALAPWLASLLE